MGLHRDLLPDELFPAEHHRASPVVGEEAVVVAAALTKALAQVIAGGAGEDGEVHVIDQNHRRIGGRFHKAVGTGLQLIRLSEKKQRKGSFWNPRGW